MDPNEYVRMAQVQERHWWFEAKRRTVNALLARHGIGIRAGERRAVLEVGPGTGSMIQVMARHGRTFAAEAYLPALRLLVEQGAGTADVVPVGADVIELPFADKSFSLVGCFDVLYHQNVGSVAAALDEIHRVCKPGGQVVITDSAFTMLRSSHDVATHAARRFRLADLTGPLQAAGFEVRHASYFHTLLFPAALAVRLAKRLVQGSPSLEGDAGSAADTGEISPHSDLAPVPGWLNAALLAIYRIETPLTVRLRMPFGSSLLVLARRRQ